MVLLNLKSFFGLLLLFDLQHLELSFSLPSLKLVLSLQSGKVSFGGCFLGCSLFGLLNGLSSKELLLLRLSLKFLSCLLLLEKLEFLRPLFVDHLFVLSLFLSLGDLVFQFLVLLEFDLTFLLFFLELLKECVLLIFLLFLQRGESFAGGVRFGAGLHEVDTAGQGYSLVVSFLGGLLQSFLHGFEFLHLVGSLWLLNSIN